MAVEEHVEQGPETGTTRADVRLERVTKRFDEVAAVDDVSLEIPRGSFFAFCALWTHPRPAALH